MNKLTLPPKFASKESQMLIHIGEVNDLHIMFFDERYTIYLPSELNKVDIEDMSKVLVETFTLLGKAKVLEGLRSFADVFNTPLLGEVKQGSIYNRDIEVNRWDVWRDEITWEEWCSPEYVAKEYYARQERLRRKK